MDFASIPEQYKSKTDAELASILPYLTSNPVPKAMVENDLRDKDQAWFGATGWKGPIADVIEQTLPAPLDELPTGVDFFLGFLRATDKDEINTSEKVFGEKPYSQKAWSILQGLKAIGLLTDQDIDDFYSFGGGRPWKDETEATIAAARVAHQAAIDAEKNRQAFQTWMIDLWDRFLSPAEIIEGTLAEKQTAYVQALRDAATAGEA